MRSSLWTPEIVRPPAPVVDGALRDLRRRERDRWRHIRDPRLDRRLPLQAAIAVDVGSDGQTSGGTTCTFAHTCTGSDRLLLLAVRGEWTDLLTVASTTYNSVAFTLIDKSIQVFNFAAYLLYLIAPASGTNNIVVTMSVSSTFSCTAVSYTGCDQSAPIDSANKGNTFGTVEAVSTTVVGANCWLSGMAASGGFLSAGTGTTMRQQNTGFPWFTLGSIDSNGTVGTGAQSLEVTLGSNDNIHLILASLLPVSAGGASQNPYQPWQGRGPQMAH